VGLDGLDTMGRNVYSRRPLSDWRFSMEDTKYTPPNTYIVTEQSRSAPPPPPRITQTSSKTPPAS
jgi:hypothetical protein